MEQRRSADDVAESHKPPEAPQAVRVLMLIDSLGPGGAERSTAATAAVLTERELDISIVTLRVEQEGFSEEVRRSGVGVRTLAPGNHLSRIRELRRLLRAEQPQILHTALFASDQIGRLAAAGLRTAVISSLVSVPQERDRSRSVLAWKLRIVEWIDIVTSRLLVDHFHAVTPGVANACIDRLHLRAERVTVVERGRSAASLGQRTPQRRRRVRALNGWAAEDSIVIAVGRHERDKAHIDLISAFERFAITHPSARLVIAGRRGSETTALEHAVDVSGSAERIELLGHRDDVADLIAAADVLVSSSTREGAAGAVIEAMAIGTPIVSTMLPGLAGVVESDRNALTVVPRDVDRLADAIGRVIDDTALADRLSRQALADFEARFTLDRAADGMIALYRRCRPRRGA